MKQSVFESSEIAGVTLQNRLIRSATHEGMADEHGAPTEALENLYVQIAKGEAGAIITGYAGIQQDGKSCLLNMLMIDRDDLIPAYRKLTDKVHEHGVPIVLQIAHCGRQTRSAVTGKPTVAPFSVKDSVFSESKPRKLGEEEIETIIENFAAATQRAEQAGFDGVQLHLGHGYLLSQFLSGHTNRRKDKWGGTTENKFRVVAEIMSRIRSSLDSYPVLAKINAYDTRPKGMRIDEAVAIAQMLETAGCNAIEISSGVAEEGLSVMRGPNPPVQALFRSHFKFRTMPAPIRTISTPFVRHTMRPRIPIRGNNLEAAKRIRQDVSIPVITVGGLHELTTISSAIETGATDYVAMCRPFIIEPTIVRRFREGTQTASRCILCNYCVLMGEMNRMKCYYGRLPKKEQ